PTVLGNMLPNELYLVSTLLQLIGFHWFVVRRPFRHRWPFVAAALALAAYTAMFLFKIPYSGNLINIPNVLLCAASAWMLFRHGRAAVSRTAAVIVSAQAAVMAYRALLTNMRYVRPWETANAHADPRWIYSLATAAFLATCMVMCYLWY